MHVPVTLTIVMVSLRISANAVRWHKMIAKGSIEWQSCKSLSRRARE